MSNNLRKVRRAKDRTQLWLMRRTGIYFATISRIEQGWLKPSQKQKRRLAKALGVTVRSLFPNS